MNKKYKKIGIVFGLVFILIALSNPLTTTFHAEAGQIPGENKPWVPNLMPYLQPGDIIFMDSLPGPGGKPWIVNIDGINSNDHCAMFVGTRPGNYWEIDWCIHAGDPVGYKRIYGDRGFTVNHTNFSIFRVATANQNQKNAAIAWERERVEQGCRWQDWASTFRGKKDWDNVYDESFLSIKWKFYCNELHWAAYYNTTYWQHHDNPSIPIIDIDYNDWGWAPWFVQCVNMGVPGVLFWWMDPPEPGYAYQNEIKIDPAMEKIYPLAEFFSYD